MILKGFIVLEGIDGAGTTTQLHRASERLRASGREVLRTCEPTPGPIGALIREGLAGRASLDQEALCRLFAADRAAHLDGPGGIREALEAGKLVLSDRYLFSSLAYQSIGMGPGLPFSLNAAFPLPELLFFFDIDPEVSLRRIAGRESLDVFENIGFQRKVAERYRAVMELYGDSGMEIVRIDASASPDTVEEAIWKSLKDRAVAQGGDARRNA